MSDVTVLETIGNSVTVINQGTVGPQGATGPQGLPGLDGASGLTVYRVNDHFSAVANAFYLVSTLSGGVTGTMPANPQTGWRVGILDVGGDLATNGLTMAGNGHDMPGGSETRTLSTPWIGETYVYDSGEWKLEEKVILDHIADTGNPHGVTAAQAGAAPASHVTDTSNPHGVTAAQIGLGNVTNEAQIPKSLGSNAGDLIYFTGAATPTRLGKGSDTQILTLISGLPVWADAGGGLSSVRVTGSTTLAVNTIHRCYLTAAATLTPPSSPSDGDYFEVWDCGKNFDTYNASVTGIVTLDMVSRTTFAYDTTTATWSWISQVED